MADAPALSGVEVAHYRGFRRLAISGLTRTSLLVGANNAGKTSILEAVETLTLGSVRGLLRSPLRRDERHNPIAEERSVEVDLSHLFFGHSMKAGASFSLIGKGRKQRRVACAVVELSHETNGDHQLLFPALETDEPLLGIQFESDLQPRPVRFSLSAAGGVLLDVSRRLQMTALEASEPVHFLGTEPLDPIRLSSLWDRIVLTSEEEQVTAALRIIEPRLERIAFVGEGARRQLRSVVVKMTGSEQRLPLGSLGDGLKRMLALALNLIPARGGFLLVDEIDTGLHYSVMADMWRLIIETARRLDVQVLATTHSLDCVRSLAWLREGDPSYERDVSLHRVERDSDKTVSYTLDEIDIAARQHLEVR